MIDERHPHEPRIQRQGLTSDAKFKLVTPQQYKEGYLVLEGMVATRRNYTALRQDENGNYVVLAPEEER